MQNLVLQLMKLLEITVLLSVSLLFGITISYYLRKSTIYGLRTPTSRRSRGSVTRSAALDLTSTMNLTSIKNDVRPINFCPENPTRNLIIDRELQFFGDSC
jgi:hypothetical protein